MHLVTPIALRPHRADMSQQSESGQYVWDEQYKRYKYITYDRKLTF